MGCRAPAGCGRGPRLPEDELRGDITSRARGCTSLRPLVRVGRHVTARCDRLVIEVNPRHVAFYRRWLGLLPYTTPRHNPRVDAPAVLMSLDFNTIRDRIALLGGQPEKMATQRSLYPLFWDTATEAAMLAKLP